MALVLDTHAAIWYLTASSNLSSDALRAIQDSMTAADPVYLPSICVVEVSAPRGVKGAEFYSLKDQEMTLKASVGLMLWDGKSAGTLANIIRLIEQQKPVVVYQAKLHELSTIKTSEDLRSLLSRSGLESEDVFELLPQVSGRTLF